MHDSDLAFFTTNELIAELMRRKTFLGVVVQSAAECKSAEWDEVQTFKVHFNSNLSATEATRLLDVVASRLDREAC